MRAVWHIIIKYTERKYHTYACPFKHKWWYAFVIRHSAFVIYIWTDLNSPFNIGVQFEIDIGQSYLATLPPIKHL